ncbi:MAG: transcriptional repressor, partial [Candidatus Moranbacteria bacterium]|nr:transcriptional repressor [Candidatus Moranbacteria bacterium]
QIILDYLQNTKSHPCAEEVFQAVKKKLPRISLGTVYRNLDNFVQKDTIKEISGETKRFDADLSQHHHFVCKKCQHVFDLDNFNPNLKKIEKKTQSIGLCHSYQIFVYGICKKCK